MTGISKYEASRVTCLIRYVLDLEKIDAFARYAHAWIELIERHGGTHHGYFLPGSGPPSAGFSFPGIGREGRRDVAIALFSFADVAAYQSYRSKVALDPDCAAAEALYRETHCFLSYERTFLQPLPGRKED